MAKLSTVERLAPEYREMIRRLRQDEGRPIKEIGDRLRGAGVHVSHGALGRHIKCLDMVSEIGVADELLQQRRAINNLARKVGELKAAIERISSRETSSTRAARRSSSGSAPGRGARTSGTSWYARCRTPPPAATSTGRCARASA